MDNQLNEAIKLVGPDAKPSGRLRIMRNSQSDRLQQEWVGSDSSVWLEIPIIHATEASSYPDLQKR